MRSSMWLEPCEAHVSEDDKAKYVLVDSGTTYFTAPSEMFVEIMRHFPEASCSASVDRCGLGSPLR